MPSRIKLLGTLVNSDHRVTLPGFCGSRPCSNHCPHALIRNVDDSVRPLTDEERQLYKVLSGVTQTPASVLSSRWREPSLTVHDMKVSGPTSASLPPEKAHSLLPKEIPYRCHRYPIDGHRANIYPHRTRSKFRGNFEVIAGIPS